MEFDIYCIRARNGEVVGIGRDSYEAWFEASNSELARHLRQVHEFGYTCEKHTIQLEDK